MPTDDKIELARSLIDGSYHNNQPRIGIEFEFKIDKSSATKISQSFIHVGPKRECFVHDDFYASFDFSQLIEFRSYPVALDDFHYDMFFELRRSASRWLRDQGINFLWYGWHFSVWGIPEHNMGVVTIQKALGKEHVLLHSEVFAEKQYSSGWYGNTWRDPFTRNYHLHKFVNAHELISQKESLTYDRASMRLGWAWFERNHELLVAASNKLPVPGCAIRVGSSRRIEFVAGWMDTQFEKQIITSMVNIAELPIPLSIPDQPDKTIRFPGSRRRVATLLLPGLSYDAPPTLPNADWESVHCDTSWRPMKGQPWPIIGEVPDYWPRDEAMPYARNVHELPETPLL